VWGEYVTVVFKTVKHWSSNYVPASTDITRAELTGTATEIE